jgi:hypothetical protein
MLHDSRTKNDVNIGEFKVPIRFDLIHALFVAAEELSEGHPFLPSPYSLERTSLEQAIEDPILSLYLDQTSRDVTFTTEHRRIIALVKPNTEGQPSQSTIWLCGVARDTVKRLNRVRTKILLAEASLEVEHEAQIDLVKFVLRPITTTLDSSSSEPTFFHQRKNVPEQEAFIRALQTRMDSEYSPGKWDQKPLIRGALEERLKMALTELKSRSGKVGLAASLLDLIRNLFPAGGGSRE